MLRKTLSLGLMLIALVTVGCGSSDLPTTAKVVAVDETTVSDVTLRIDLTDALLNAGEGDLILTTNNYMVVTEVDVAHRNIRLKWFHWTGDPIWYSIDKLVSGRFDETIYKYWQFNSPGWRKNICRYINRNCP